MEEEALFEDPRTGDQKILPIRLAETLGYRRLVETPAELQDSPMTPTGQAEAELEHAISVILGVFANPYESLSDKQQELLGRMADELERSESYGEALSLMAAPSEPEKPAPKKATAAKKADAAPAVASAPTGTTAPTDQVTTPPTQTTDESQAQGNQG